MACLYKSGGLLYMNWLRLSSPKTIYFANTNLRVLNGNGAIANKGDVLGEYVSGRLRSNTIYSNHYIEEKPITNYYAIFTFKNEGQQKTYEIWLNGFEREKILYFKNVEREKILYSNNDILRILLDKKIITDKPLENTLQEDNKNTEQEKNAEKEDNTVKPFGGKSRKSRKSRRNKTKQNKTKRNKKRVKK